MTTDATPTVLIVEDETDLADLYAVWLEEDHDVRLAYSGEEALDELAEGVDVVLLDRRMPGLSGDEVLETIRERGFDCRVAMVTAVEPDFDILDMGFDDYLEKPVSREELRATLDRLHTRTEYNDKVDEYVSLVTKKATLEAEKTDAELEESAEFAELEARIDDLRTDVDPMAEDFDDTDVAAVLRDLAVTEV